MARLQKLKLDLLRFLDRPKIPLHTNSSENNIRTVICPCYDFWRGHVWMRFDSTTAHFPAVQIAQCAPGRPVGSKSAAYNDFGPAVPLQYLLRKP